MHTVGRAELLCAVPSNTTYQSLPPSDVFASFPVNVLAVAGFLPLVLGMEVFPMSLCPLVTSPPDFREGGGGVRDQSLGEARGRVPRAAVWREGSLTQICGLTAGGCNPQPVTRPGCTLVLV